MIATDPSDRTLVVSNPTTTISVTLTPAEEPTQAITNTYVLTLIDPCVNTVLTQAITLSNMLITALRVTPETF